MTDHEKLRTTLLAFGELVGKEITEAVLTLYWLALKPYGDDQVMAAFTTGVRKWNLFGRLPYPSEVIEEIEGKREDSALVAWEQLQEAVRRAGRYQSVLFDDAKISRVVEVLGGWELVCDWSISEMGIHRAQFLKAYQALDTPGENRPLTGLHARQNAAAGYVEHVGQPVHVSKRTGDDRKRLELTH
jgi:hypothetical protein